jgi:HEPN domain-containing protein
LEALSQVERRYLRVEALWWLEQARRDLRMAEELLKFGLFEGIVYHSHQAAGRR